jgi:hypothetical protein
MHLEFRTIIRMQTLNFEIKLCLYKAKKRFNKGTSLRLAFHEMHPSKPGIIIHNRERKKTEPFIDGVAIGPQISQWTISKGIQVWVVCTGKWILCCLAKGQTEQMSLLIQEISGKLWRKDCILDAKGWPNL